jgi:aspartyl-tRNA(Asn)/glutamyl-tRNA(Gln) amidotransferase subunit C
MDKTKIDIKKIANIAKLKLSESEEEKYYNDLKKILTVFKNISEINTDNIKPTFQPIKVKNTLREDKILPSLKIEEALSNTKNKKDRHFTGPKAI